MENQVFPKNTLKKAGILSRGHVCCISPLVAKGFASRTTRLFFPPVVSQNTLYPHHVPQRRYLA